MSIPERPYRWPPVRRRHAMTLAMATVAATGLDVDASAQGGSMTISFAPAAPGGLPDGFASARTGSGSPAVWTTIADPAATGGHLLVQTSTDPTDYRFPLAIYDRLPAADIDVTVRFKAIGGRIDRAAGIAVRLADPDNYYVVRANALEDNVNFYRVVNGVRREIKGAAAPVAPNAWHTLGLRAQSDQFTIVFDGKTLFTTTDRTFTAHGKLALWTKADSITQFDALVVKVLP